MGRERTAASLQRPSLHPDVVRRRIVPEAAQVQIILGSLLGGADLAGRRGERWLVLADPRADYVRWKYERLATLALAPPEITPERAAFRTIAHPLFDDLARVSRLSQRERSRVLRPLLGPLGLAVWMADSGRLELRADVFVMLRRTVAA